MQYSSFIIFVNHLNQNLLGGIVFGVYRLKSFRFSCLIGWCHGSTIFLLFLWCIGGIYIYIYIYIASLEEGAQRC